MKCALQRIIAMANVAVLMFGVVVGVFVSVLLAACGICLHWLLGSSFWSFCEFLNNSTVA